MTRSDTIIENEAPAAPGKSGSEPLVQSSNQGFRGAPDPKPLNAAIPPTDDLHAGYPIAEPYEPPTNEEGVAEHVFKIPNAANPPGNLSAALRRATPGVSPTSFRPGRKTQGSEGGYQMQKGPRR